MSPAEADWKRVGEMLQERRVELDSRYSNRQFFADDRGINYRLAFDVEKGARANYSRPVITSIEVAYGLARGALASALAGGELEAADTAPAVARRVLTDEQRQRLEAFTAIVRSQREEREGNGGRATGT